MTLKHKAVKGVFWTSTQNWGANLLTLAVVAVLAHLLEPEDFGLVALALVFVSAAQILHKLGFGPAIVQRSEIDAAHLDSAFWANLVSSLLLAALATAAAGPLAALLKEPELAPIIRWLAISFPLGGLTTTQEAILQREFDFRALALRRLAGTAAGGATGIGLALSGFGVMSLVAQHLVAAAVSTVVLWLGSPWRPRRRVSRRHLDELMGFGLPVMGLDALNFVNRRVYDLFIGSFLGAAALGYYSIGLRAVRSANELFAQSLLPIALPTFSRMNEDPDRMRDAFCSAVQMASVVALPVFAGIAVLAPEVVTVLFGAKWEPSIPVLMIMSINGLLTPLAMFTRPLMMAAGKPRWVLWLGVLNTVLNLALITTVLALDGGIVEVALVITLRAYVVQPLPLVLLHRLVHLSPWRLVKDSAGALAATAVMAGAVLVARRLLVPVAPDPAVLASCAVLGAGVYAAVLLATAPALCRKTLGLLRLSLPEVRRRVGP